MTERKSSEGEKIAREYRGRFAYETGVPQGGPWGTLSEETKAVWERAAQAVLDHLTTVLTREEAILARLEPAHFRAYLRTHGYELQPRSPWPDREAWRRLRGTSTADTLYMTSSDHYAETFTKGVELGLLAYAERRHRALVLADLMALHPEIF